MAAGRLKLDSAGARDTAGAILLQSLAVARDQGALSWELRAAMSLARLRQQQGHVRDAKTILAPVHSRFTEGTATADFIAAADLLKALD